MGNVAVRHCLPPRPVNHAALEAAALAERREADVGITEARGRGGGGGPRGLTMNVVPGPREGLVRPDPGSTPGRPAAV